MPDEESNLPEPSAVMTRSDFVYQAKLRGLSAVDIAREINIPVADVHAIVNRRMGLEIQEQTQEEREGILALQNARYEYMLSKLWDQIEYGEVKAITSGMQLVDRIVKLNRLDIEDAASGQATILVVGGQESEYITELKKMVVEK